MIKNDGGAIKSKNIILTRFLEIHSGRPEWELLDPKTTCSHLKAGPAEGGENRYKTTPLCDGLKLAYIFLSMFFFLLHNLYNKLKENCEIFQAISKTPANNAVEETAGALEF